MPRYAAGKGVCDQSRGGLWWACVNKEREIPEKARNMLLRLACRILERGGSLLNTLRE